MSLKISGIWLKNYKQFKDTYIDLTNPETGEPVEKVCFIGPNGTGKSGILFLLHTLFWRKNIVQSENGLVERQLVNLRDSIVGIKFHYSNFSFHYVARGPESGIFVKDVDNFETLLEDLLSMEFYEFHNYLLKNQQQQVQDADRHVFYQTEDAMAFMPNRRNIIVNVPSESRNNTLIDLASVPETNLNKAYNINNQYPAFNEVDNSTASDFWNILIYNIKQREEQQLKYENDPQNIDKTKRELLSSFDKQYPQILDAIALLWNKVLSKCNLTFDVENARKPYQLTDNLHAYIVDNASKNTIPYNELSTGIRNFIFKLGHIRSLFFNREIDKGFVFVDEPENSLFPDLLYDLIDTYLDIFKDKRGENNVQFFVATHSPIIAAQFEPYERIILEWDEPGSVKARKGSAPAGDDPNDVLEKDFQVRHLMGRKGQQMWERYLELKKQLRRESDEQQKTKLTEEILKIGGDYNF